MKRSKLIYGLCLIVIAGVSGELGAQDFRGAVCGPFHLKDGRDSSLSLQPAEGQDGRYQAHFRWPGARPDHPLLLRVPPQESAYELWVNGIHMGGDSLSLATALFDIGPFLKKGSNDIEVYCGTSCPALRTMLMPREKLYLSSYMVEMHPGAEASLILRFRLNISSSHKYSAGSYTAKLQLTDPDGIILLTRELPQGKIPAYGQQSQLEVDLKLDSAMYWLPGKPCIYHASFSLEENGNGLKEEVELPFYLQNFRIEKSLLIYRMDSIPVNLPTDRLPGDQVFLLGKQGILSLPAVK